MRKERTLRGITVLRITSQDDPYLEHQKWSCVTHFFASFSGLEHYANAIDGTIVARDPKHSAEKRHGLE